MQNRQSLWLWIATAVSFVVGFVLVMNDSGAGWFLIILGIIYLGASTRPAQSWATSNPGIARWGLIGVTILLVLLVVIVFAVFLLK